MFLYTHAYTILILKLTIELCREIWSPLPKFLLYSFCIRQICILLPEYLCIAVVMIDNLTIQIIWLLNCTAKSVHESYEILSIIFSTNTCVYFVNIK